MENSMLPIDEQTGDSGRRAVSGSDGRVVLQMKADYSSCAKRSSDNSHKQSSKSKTDSASRIFFPVADDINFPCAGHLNRRLLYNPATWPE